MTEKLKKTFLEYKFLVFPFLLAVVLSSSILKIYAIDFISIWNMVSIVLCFLAFCFCIFVNKHRLIGTLLTILISAGLVFLFFIFSMSNDFGQGFRQWFFTGTERQETQLNYILAVLSIFPIFFSMVIYYFSNIQYRFFFLIVVSFIPCTLYIKVLSEISNIYLCFIVVLNMIILLINKKIQQPDLDTSTKLSDIKPFVLSSALIIFVTTIISALIPKQSEAVYYDKFEKLFMDSNTTLELNQSYSNISEYSGDASSYRDYLNRKIFSLYGNDIPYLKRQTFDYYDFENDRWYYDDDCFKNMVSSQKYSENLSSLSLTNLQLAIKEATSNDSDFADKYNLSEFISMETIQDSIETIYVIPENFQTVYYLSTSKTISVTPYNTIDDIIVTKNGVFYHSDLTETQGNSYQISYYNEIENRFKWLYSGLADFTTEQSQQMLEELSSSSTKYSDTAKAFAEQSRAAEEYAESYAENTKKISDEIKNLASDITKDYQYDYEKADALQNYLISSEFTYDLDFKAEDDSAEYFLFNSKTGTCSDFASAFVLMARSVGLTARYVEGYIPEEELQNGMYSIEDNDSHAYAEVYIQNIGWLVYDATKPSAYSREQQDSNLISDLTQFSDFEVDYELTFTIAAAFLGGVILLLVVAIFMPLADEGVFLIRVNLSNPQKSIKLLYLRLKKKKLKNILDKNINYTPQEVFGTVKEKYNFDISQLISIAEKSLYSGHNTTNDEKKKAIELYKSVKKKRLSNN